MKKVLLQINSVANTGSTGRIVEEIGRLANSYGYKIYVAFARKNVNSKFSIIQIGSKLDIIIHGIFSRLFDNHGFGSKKSTNKLITEISKIKPDIIHLHNLHGYYLNIEILFKFLAYSNIPVVWTFHDCWSFTGHCSHFEYIKCDKWKRQCKSCPQINEYPKSYFRDNSYKNYLRKKKLFCSLKNIRIVAVSEWMEHLIKESYLNIYPITTIRNGVDTNIFRYSYSSYIKSKYKIPNRNIILGVANVWTKKKGFDDFIELSKKLSTDFIIVLVGISKKQFNSLNSKIIGISHTENLHELASLYSISHIFFNPTYEDNFPTTNLEAMSCGTPVVVYDTGGCSESITNKTGVVVKQGDLNEALRMFKVIIDNGKTHYFNSCVKHIKENFNQFSLFKKYIEIYEDIL